MRNPTQTDTTAIELLPRHDGPEDSSTWTNKYGRYAGDETPRRPRQRWKNWHEIILAAVLVACCVPVAVLAALSSKLSEKMAWNGCLSSGDFALPLTSSVWDTAHFFTITIAFTGPGSESCSYNDWQSNDMSACIGYTFAQAKVIDLAWDVILGRGSQVVLVWVAYRLYRRVLDALMQRGEVAFDLFESIAFTPGTLRSVAMLCKHGFGLTPLPRTRHAKLLYAGMALGTLYIVALPTLLSGMTGYASYFVPYLDVYDYNTNSSISYNNGGVQYLTCRGQVLPLWGELGDWSGSSNSNPGYGGPTWVYMYEEEYQNGGTYQYYDWPEYYQRYMPSIFSKCPQNINISSCAAANVSTYVLAVDSKNVPNRQDIVAPAPGIVAYPDSVAGHTSHWLCNQEVFNTSNLVSLDQAPYLGQVAGTCQAGGGYVWGFSFLFTFVVAVLTLLFAVLMYAMWLDVRRYAQIEGKYGCLKDAMIISAQARQRLGEESMNWSARTLTEKVSNGKVGMLADLEVVRRRRTEERKERRLSGASFGDPGRGDWGGDVIEEDNRRQS